MGAAVEMSATWPLSGGKRAYDARLRKAAEEVTSKQTASAIILPDDTNRAITRPNVRARFGPRARG
jgi:hypothetical protein